MTLETLEKIKSVTTEEGLTSGVWAELDSEGGKGERRMEEIMKSAEIVGQILGLLMGHNFTTPACKISEEDSFAMINMPL